MVIISKRKYHIILLARFIKKLNKISALASEYPGWMVAIQSEGRWPES